MRRKACLMLFLFASVIIYTKLSMAQDLVPFPIVAYGGNPYLASDNLNIAQAGFNVRLGDDIAGQWSNGIKSIVSVNFKPWVYGQKLSGKFSYETDTNDWANGAREEDSHGQPIFLNLDNFIGNHQVQDDDALNGLATFVLKSEGQDTVVYDMIYPYERFMRPQDVDSVDVDDDGNVSFKTKFLLKIDSYSLPEPEKVAKIFIDKDGVELTSKTVWTNQLIPYREYQTISLDYSMPITETDVEMTFGVWSYATVDFYVDAITGSDENYDYLTAPDPNNWNGSMNYFVDSYSGSGNDTLILHWYMYDEPKFPVFMANKDVYNFLKAPQRTMPKIGVNAINQIYYAREAGELWSPDVMWYVGYPFDTATDQTTIDDDDSKKHPNYPSEHSLQHVIYDFLTDIEEYYEESGIADAENREYWGIIQAHGFFPKPYQCKNKRLPEPEEIRLEAYLYMAYGAKGLAYFRYASNPSIIDSLTWVGLDNCDWPLVPVPKAQRTEEVKMYGLVNNETGSWQKSQMKQWDEVQNLNSDLIKIGPVFRKLELDTAYTEGIDTRPTASVVRGISSSEYPNWPFIEVSDFTPSDPSDNDRYFMLVNRRVQPSNPDETQNLTVTLETTDKQRLIEDVLASRKDSDDDDDRVAYTILSAEEDDFTVTLNPGEGRLFRLSTSGLSDTIKADTYWSGDLWIQGTYIIPSGLTLTKEAGTIVTWNTGSKMVIDGGTMKLESGLSVREELEVKAGSLIELEPDKLLQFISGGVGTFSGTSNSNVTIQSISGKFKWINYGTPSSGTMQYVDVINSNYGIRVKNASSTTIDNCTIANSIGSAGVSGILIEGTSSHPTVTNNDIYRVNIGINIKGGSSTYTTTIQYNKLGRSNGTLNDGIHLNVTGKKVEILDNTIKFADKAINVSNADGNILIRHNGLDGAGGQTYGVFSEGAFSAIVDSNINADFTYGFYIDENSNFPSQVGNNNITGSNKHVYNDWGGDDPVNMENNYWYESPDTSSKFYGPVDYDPWLASPVPGAGPGDPGMGKRSAGSVVVLPEDFELSVPYPNPFNPSTRLDYALPRESRVLVRIYNLRGQLVNMLIDGIQRAGYHELVWKGEDLRGSPVSSGLYIVSFTAEEGGNIALRRAQKLMLIK